MEINGYKRVTQQTFKRYLEEDLDKAEKALKESAIVPWKDTIEQLIAFSNHKKAYDFCLILSLNRAFELSSSYAEKRELNDILTRGAYSNDRRDFAQKTYLLNDVFYRDDFERVALDEGGRYYLNKKNGKKYHDISFSTVNSYVNPFNPTKWIVSLKNQFPDATDEEIELIMKEQKIAGSTRGSQMHEMIETYLSDRFLFKNTFDFSEYQEGLKQFNQILPYIKYNFDDVIAIEPFLHWDCSDLIDRPNSGILGYADLLAVHEGKLIIADWKSAKRYTRPEYCDKHKKQVSIYCLMAKQTLDLTIDEARVVISPLMGSKIQVISLSQNEIKYWANEFIKDMVRYYKDLDTFLEAK